MPMNYLQFSFRSRSWLMPAPGWARCARSCGLSVLRDNLSSQTQLEKELISTPNLLIRWPNSSQWQGVISAPAHPPCLVRFAQVFQETGQIPQLPLQQAQEKSDFPRISLAITPWSYLKDTWRHLKDVMCTWLRGGLDVRRFFQP